MSSCSRSSRDRHKGGHTHCDSCYTRRCRARVEPSVCCPLSTCRLLCGALFHLCKEEDHLLLCPNVRVPCINYEFGCPLQMPRSSRAEHLQYCPASVISCSMEWNRWPAQDAHSHQNTELHENLMSERVKGGCLDLAMALKDQDRLFHSLKMKKLFPELTQRVEKEDEEEEKRREKEKLKKAAMTKEAALKPTTWQSFDKYNYTALTEKDYDDDDDEEEEEDILEELFEVAPERELTQAEREALAYHQGVQPELLESYNAWERMFSMEMGGCREAGAAPETAKGKCLSTLSEEDESNEGCSGAAAAVNKQTTAPVPAPACPRVTKNFTYGKIEPMKIITVRTFKVPTSFQARPSRIRNPWSRRRENKTVDTSDLGVTLQDMPVWEEIQASLLCSLEREQRGHMIAESVSTDALLTDEGTQTYHFLSTPFRSDASLRDLSETKTPELHLQLQVESVTSRHHKASSVFTFLCGQSFQRREYGLHYKNIHSDIHMCVNGWFEQRCPLAYLGCTFSQRRFRPSTYDATVNYNEELGCFSLHPSSPVSRDSNSTQDAPSTFQSAPQRRERRAAGGEDPLSSLPYEVLCHVASFLDSLSLSQLALVSHLMRQVCSSQLQDRGMVTLHWAKKTSSNGQAKWRVTHKIWEFSTLFAPVDSWRFCDVPPLSEHLRMCPHYQTEPRNERVLLPKIREQLHNDTNCKGPTLVSLFKNNKLIM
ncbi:F-box only protein 40-like [Periophthalmus magnuspinnatus]|uniref:F-box only protein 40-like n=1 Tax=Periophthalmus magnuspinnatus TaxID=409849 RepID=UPI002436F45B|nr:F-box only protein 40-like [Periophthalmus magnuspinnatus]